MMPHGLKVYDDAGDVTVDGDYQMMSLVEEGSVVTAAWTASVAAAIITLATPIPVDDAPVLFARLSDQTKEFGPLFVSVSSGQVIGFTVPVNGIGLTLYWRVAVRRSNANLDPPSGYGLAVYDEAGLIALDSSQHLALIAFQDDLAGPDYTQYQTSSTSVAHAVQDAFICLNPIKFLFAVPAGIQGLILIVSLAVKVEDNLVTLKYYVITPFSGSPGQIGGGHSPFPIILMRSTQSP